MRGNMSTNEDAMAKELADVFSQAVASLRERGLSSPLLLEMEAMDLLMDHVLQLGPEGLADVLFMLASDRTGGETTRTQAAVAIERYCVG
jgi:hypothetical protein